MVRSRNSNPWWNIDGAGKGKREGVRPNARSLRGWRRKPTTTTTTRKGSRGCRQRRQRRSP